MKKMKRLISLILVIALALSNVIVIASAVNAGITDFSVISTVGEKELVIRWWQGSEKHYLFMPSDAELSDLTVKYTASAEVFLDDNLLINGGNISIESDTEYTLSCDGNAYKTM